MVVVNVDLVKNAVVELEIVRTIGRTLAGNDVHDERHPTLGRRALQILLVIADEGVCVGIIGGRIFGDQRPSRWLAAKEGSAARQAAISTPDESIALVFGFIGSSVLHHTR
jgi:hypothetical protein